MNSIKESLLSKIFLLAALGFVLLAMIGGVRGYSPVPFWDMWNGYLGFFVNVMDGDVAAWWAQHNEHRIVLARIFFWLDFVLFGGRGWFLIIVNYLLQALVCILFWIIWKDSKSGKQNWIGFFLIVWLFWWIQKENLEWGFQSQFILAQMLPLAALYFLHRSFNRIQTGLNKWFILALALGVLSVGSMANGVLALPIMTVYAVLTRMGLRRIFTLGIASVLTLALYFQGYVAPVGHGSLVQAVSTNPIGLLHYVVVYVGGPFSFGNTNVGVLTATIAGTFLVGSSVFIAIKVSANPREETLRLALLAFILYIGGTALGTAGGRLIFGVETALAGRYMTPSLMAWAALLILNLPQINTWRPSLQNKLWIGFAVLLLLMLPKQLESLGSQKARNFERQLAALAVELGVKDEAQIKHVFPSVPWIMAIAEKPVSQNLSIFGLSPVKDKRQIIGKSIKIASIRNTCLGSIDQINGVDGDPMYMKARGWIFDPIKKEVPEYGLIVNDVGVVHGVLLTGEDRIDVANTVNHKALYSGVKGYFMHGLQGDKLKIYNPDNSCLLPAFNKSS